MKRKIILIMISVLPLGFVVLYIRAIIVLMSCIFFDKCYSIREKCIDKACYAIVNESKLSINSHVATYFFSSNFLPIPLINKNYVFFDDDTEFCVINREGSSFELITRINPESNKITSSVRIKNMGTHDLPCIVDVR